MASGTLYSCSRICLLGWFWKFRVCCLQHFSFGIIYLLLFSMCSDISRCPLSPFLSYFLKQFLLLSSSSMHFHRFVIFPCHMLGHGINSTPMSLNLILIIIHTSRRCDLHIPFCTTVAKLSLMHQGVALWISLKQVNCVQHYL